MNQFFAFQLHITDTCDQRCKHCYIFSEDVHMPVQEMPLDKIISVIGNCLDMCEKTKRLPYFYITGGDPILHKDFWKVLEFLKSLDIPFSILGNPFHLNDDVCRRMKEYGCERYQLSIDGLRETHDGIRKKGSFDTTLEKVQCLKNAGIRAVVMNTVSGENKHELWEIIDLVVAHHVDVFAFARYAPTSFQKSTHIEPLEYRELLGQCWERFEKYKNSGTTFYLKDHLWTLFLHEKGLYQIPDNLDTDTIYDGCNCANCHMTITPTGDVSACRRMESWVGNVFESSMQEIFLGEKMDAYRDYQKFEKCSKCELLRFCRGCPAVAYGYTHNSFAADPQCWKEV